MEALAVLSLLLAGALVVALAATLTMTLVRVRQIARVLADTRRALELGAERTRALGRHLGCLERLGEAGAHPLLPEERQPVP